MTNNQRSGVLEIVLGLGVAALLIIVIALWGSKL